MYRVGAHLIVMGNPMLLHVEVAAGIGSGVAEAKVLERVVIDYRATVPIPFIVHRRQPHIVELPTGILTK